MNLFPSTLPQCHLLFGQHTFFNQPWKPWDTGCATTGSARAQQHAHLRARTTAVLLRRPIVVMLEVIADSCHLDNLGDFIVQFEKLPLPMQQLDTSAKELMKLKLSSELTETEEGKVLGTITPSPACLPHPSTSPCGPCLCSPEI